MPSCKQIRSSAFAAFAQARLSQVSGMRLPGRYWIAKYITNYQECRLPSSTPSAAYDQDDKGIKSL